MLFLAFSCSDPNFKPILKFAIAVFRAITIIAPSLLMLLGVIDFAKAALSNDDDALKKGGSAFVRRAIAAIIVFLIVTIVNYITWFVHREDWKACWGQVETINDYPTVTLKYYFK